MLDRLPGRSEPALAGRPRSTSSISPSRRTPASSARPSTGRASRETRPANGANPFDPRLPLRRPRRVRPQRRPARDGGHADDLGDTAVGERRQGPELRPDRHDATCRTSPGARLPLLGPLQRLPVRPLLLGLERVEPRPVPLAAVRLEGQAGRAGDLREALPRRLRRDQAGNSRALVGVGETSARGRDHYLGRQGHAGDRVARASSRSCSRSRSRLLQVRRLVAPPVPDGDQRQAARRTSAGRT